MSDILLIHGSCHGAWCYEGLITELTGLGHNARAIDLPGAGQDTTPYPAVTLDSYAEAICDALGPRTLLLGHSAAGFAITAAAERRPERIARLVYLCAYVPAPGRTMLDLRRAQARQPLSGALVKRDDGLSYTLRPEVAARVFYQDCSEEQRRLALARLGPQPIARDAETIVALARGDASLDLQLLPELYGDVAQLRATAALAMTELSDGDVADARVLARVRDAKHVELLRAAISLAAPAFATAWHRELLASCLERLERLRAPMAEATERCPALQGADVELVWSLGARGRAFERRVLVGVPDDWSGLAPESPAVLAMHEAMVRDAGRRESGDYVRAEWSALSAVARQLADASDALRDAHASWLAGLDLAPLVTQARALGLCEARAAAQLIDAPSERASVFAQL